MNIKRDSLPEVLSLQQFQADTEHSLLREALRVCEQRFNLDYRENLASLVGDSDELTEEGFAELRNKERVEMRAFVLAARKLLKYE